MQHEDIEKSFRQSMIPFVAHLERARTALPIESMGEADLIRYRSHLEADEYDLAFDMLEVLSAKIVVPREFNLSMCEASVMLALYDRARHYKSLWAVH